jgi:AcrR family transcriptional regulator
MPSVGRPKQIDDEAPVSPKSKKVFSKSEKTRQRILEAAAVTFGEVGYFHARMQDIAALAGTQAGTIYYYFPSREDLVQEVLSGSVNRVHRAVQQRLSRLSPDIGIVERIREAVVAHVSFVLTGDIFVRAYLRIENQVAPQVRNAIVENPRHYDLLWRNLLNEARDAGLLRKEADLTVCRQFIIGAMVWTSAWYREGKLSPEEIGYQMADMFVSGAFVAPEPATRKGPHRQRTHRRSISQR